MDTAPLPLVTLIVVTYNSAATIRLCLTALADQSYGHFEVVVVDNGSVDGTTAIVQNEFPTFKLIKNHDNRGFAAANNQAMRQACGDYVGLINPDVELHRKWIAEAVACIESTSDTAIVGSKVFFSNQIILQHVGGVISPNALTSHLGDGEFDIGQHEQVQDVDYVIGAALLIRREVAAALDYLDERYFMYFEETDLCVRARQHGYRVVYCPTAIATHHEKQSFSHAPDDRPSWRYLRRYHISRLKFVYKNYSREAFLHDFLPVERQWLRHDVGGLHRQIVLLAYVITLPDLLVCLFGRRAPQQDRLTTSRERP